MPHIDLVDLAAMLILGVLCWGLRVAFVLLVPADRLPAIVARALQYLAPAALASICAAELAGVVGTAGLASTAGSLCVVAAAGVVAVWSRNATWTVLVGILGVLLLDLVLLG